MFLSGLRVAAVCCFLHRGSLFCGSTSSLGSFFSGLVSPMSGSAFSLSPFPSLCLASFLAFSFGLMVCPPPELSPLSSPLLYSPVNKHPEPTPRRAGTVIRKQAQLTSPTFQPTLASLESGGPSQQPPVLPLAAEPGLSGTGGVGGDAQGGGVQAATVQPHVVTQLGAEESR